MSADDHVTLQDWIEATAHATLDLAPTLGYPGGRVTRFLGRPSEHHGACIPMISDIDCWQIGFVADVDTCQELGRALLGMRSTQRDLGPEDLADAIGELVNLLAGGVKTRIIDRKPTVRLGLPVLLPADGDIRIVRHQEVRCAELQLGPTLTQLIVFRHELDPDGGG